MEEMRDGSEELTKKTENIENTEKGPDVTAEPEEREETGTRNSGTGRRRPSPFAKGALMGLGIGVAAVIITVAALAPSLKEKWIMKTLKEEAYTDISEEEMQEGAYDGILASLGDSYADYYTREETEEIQNTRSGSYEGIGIAISELEDGTCAVVTVYAGSSAEEAGVQVGDLIEKVGETSAEGLTSTEIVELIGDMDPVTMTFSHEGVSYEAVMEKRAIDIPTVEGEMKENGVGYIAISHFRQNTAEQFIETLSELKEEGMTSLIIDLRENGGGLVDVTRACLEAILPEGLMFYTETRSGVGETFYATGSDPLDIPLVILVNENSASAAEIFAGACRDRLGATLVGKTTFGKGIIQTTRTYEDGSSIKYTTSHYFTPDGYDLNGVGLVPDEEVDLPEETTVVACDDNDTQYQKALECLVGASDSQ